MNDRSASLIAALAHTLTLHNTYGRKLTEEQIDAARIEAFTMIALSDEVVSGIMDRFDEANATAEADTRTTYMREYKRRYRAKMKKAKAAKKQLKASVKQIAKTEVAVESPAAAIAAPKKRGRPRKIVETQPVTPTPTVTSKKKGRKLVTDILNTPVDQLNFTA